MEGWPPTHVHALHSLPRGEALYEAFLEAGGGVSQPAPEAVPVAMGRVLNVPDALGARGHTWAGGPP